MTRQRRQLLPVACVILAVTGCTGTSDPASTASATQPAAAQPASTEPATTQPVTTQPAATPPPRTTSSATPTTIAAPDADQLVLEWFEVPAGSRPHDVAPAVDGGVWYTAQGTGELGHLDPVSGATGHIDLGAGSAPHGVIVGPDGAPWITDAGLNAIVRVDPADGEATVHRLPDDRPGANLNTATFDDEGILWFTGQSGIFGQLDPVSGAMAVHDAPGGAGPYGITTTPEGVVWYASLAGDHIAVVSPEGTATVVDPPTAGQGARRVWAASDGAVWVSEWNAGQVSRHDPATGEWRTWRLPGDAPQAYAVYVDENDVVWLSDFGANAMVRFVPDTETFDVFPLPHDDGRVRQIHGRPGEVWGAESATDHLIVIRHR